MLIEILQRAADQSQKLGNSKFSKNYWLLADKLASCRRRKRCGSLACPNCARAFQRAKTAAQTAIIRKLAKKRTAKILVMATVVPLHLSYTPAQLNQLDILKKKRWLKDQLTKAALKRVIIGSADIGWEYRRGQHYYQLHWHLGMWTNNPEKLTAKLLKIFPADNKHDRPVVISKSFSLGFIPYMNKALKLPDLLRRNRTHLSKLLLVLDQINPLDLMVICKLRLSAQSGGLVLRPLPRKKS